MRRPLVVLAAMVAAFLVVTIAVFVVLAVRSSDMPSSGPKTAVIVDQLSLTNPNPVFITAASKILAETGYTVDYFPGEEVTVEFYRHLPERDYDLIIFRTHSTATGRSMDPVTGEVTTRNKVSLFTGEPYDDTKYVDEQKSLYLARTRYFEGAPPLFGISSAFITHSMRGRFDKSLIILMGCSGLRFDDTAEAFLGKGAGTVVGWSGPVLATYTDTATQRLLERLLVEDRPLEEAVVWTSMDTGPDPQYGSQLRRLPDGERAFAWLGYGGLLMAYGFIFAWGVVLVRRGLRVRSSL